MFNPITKFHFHCQLVLPLVYDDSLSYYEALCKMRAKLNEIIAAYNELINYYNSLADLLDEFRNKITEVDNKLAELEARQNAFEENINSEFDTLEDRLQNTVNQAITQMNQTIQGEIAKQNQYLNQQIVLINNQIEANNKEIKTWVKNVLKTFEAKIPSLQGVQVIDPSSGNTVGIQDFIDSVFTLYSEETGEKVNIKDYVRMNNDYIRQGGSLTVDEYDNSDISAVEYEAKNITAYEYDWNSNNYLGLEPEKEDNNDTNY